MWIDDFAVSKAIKPVIVTDDGQINGCISIGSNLTFPDGVIWFDAISVKHFPREC